MGDMGGHVEIHRPVGANADQRGNSGWRFITTVP
jgi:hypothetical protein